MKNPRPSFALSLFTALLLCAGLRAQAPSLRSGDVTVRLIEGLDSAKDQPGTATHAVITKSTNPAIPKNAPAFVQLGVDPSSGGLGVQLVQISVGGKQIATASTTAVMGGGFLGKMNNGLNSMGSKANHQQVSLVGPHVYLPENTVVQFTLVNPTSSTAEGTGSGSASTSPGSSGPNVWQSIKLPSESQDNPSPGSAVTLSGVAASGTKRGRVHLQVACFPTYFPGTSFTIAQALMDFTPTDIANFAGEGEAKIGLLTIGDGAEQTIPIYADLAPRSPVKLGIKVSVDFYSAAYAGKPLKLSILPPGGKGTRVDATFTLPTDSAPLVAIASPCLAEQKRQEDAAAKSYAELKAKIVVSCPATKAGKPLDNMRVKIMPVGRILKGNETDGTVMEWNLALKKGEHAVLECNYAPLAKGSPATRVTLPIPASAASCEAATDGTNPVDGTCSRK